MTHVLFLGGTRFIGAAAVRALIADGNSVTVFHRGSTESAARRRPPHPRRPRGPRRARERAARGEADVVVDMRALKAADTAVVQDVFRGHARRHVLILSRPEASAVLPRCFVDDVGRTIAMAATDDRAAGRTYNVVDDPSFVERDWVALVARVLRWEGRVVELSADAMPAHMKDDEPTDWSVSIAVSARRIFSELGWSVRPPREEAIARTVEWELAHPPEKLPPRDDELVPFPFE